MNEQYLRQLRREVIDRHANLMKDSKRVERLREAGAATIAVVIVGAVIAVLSETQLALIVFLCLVAATAFMLLCSAQLGEYAEKLLPEYSKPLHIQHQERMLKEAFRDYLDAYFVSIHQSLNGSDFALDLARLVATRDNGHYWRIDVRQESFELTGSERRNSAPGTVS